MGALRRIGLSEIGILNAKPNSQKVIAAVPDGLQELMTGGGLNLPVESFLPRQLISKVRLERAPRFPLSDIDERDASRLIDNKTTQSGRHSALMSLLWPGY